MTLDAEGIEYVKQMGEMMQYAGDPFTDPEVLRDLSEDFSPSVRTNVAANPSTPYHVVKRMMFDSHLYVRLSAASNRTLGLCGVLFAAADADEWVRAGAVENPLLPFKGLLKLAEDKDKFVSRKAIEWLMEMDAEQFDAGLIECGLTKLTGIKSRSWVLRALGVN